MDGKNKAPILYDFNISMSGIHGTYTICEQGFSYPTTHSIQLSSFGQNWFNFKFLFVISSSDILQHTVHLDCTDIQPCDYYKQWVLFFIIYRKMQAVP